MNPEPGAPVVLIVEDEVMILDLMRVVLQTAGYNVMAAQNGVKAVNILDGPENVDLLITDIIMPEMDGVDLVRWALAVRPGLGVLITCGWSGNPRLQNEPDLSQLPCLQKPFVPEQLVRAVQGILSLTAG